MRLRAIGHRSVFQFLKPAVRCLHRGLSGGFLGLWLVGTSAALSDEATEHFERRIRPVLVERCLTCHGAEQAKGGLRLDTRAGWVHGGESGPAITPGEPEGSLLLEAIRGAPGDWRMPPAEAGPALTEAQIADFVSWIKQGAVDPRTGPEKQATTGWTELYAERSRWWSLQPVQDVTVPEVDDPAWSGGVIDRLIKARMDDAGIVPSPRSDDATLARRVAMVLTGLPPGTVAELTGGSPDLPSNLTTPEDYAAWVDRCLDSPHFAERWTRHWLDVVRFTETLGNEWNYDAAYAWRYRDYVIRAFHQDLPFDQFVREHIAGDLLEPRWDATGRYNEAPIGTGFFRFGEVNHDSCVQFRVIGFDIVDNQVDTLTKAFQATTVACARCHDHKLDAISARDYHAVLGVLRSSRSVMRSIDHPDVFHAGKSQLEALKPELRAALLDVWRNEAAGINEERLQRLTADLKEPLTDVGDPRYAWFHASRNPTVVEGWKEAVAAVTREAEARAAREADYTVLADFRHGLPPDWFAEGAGLAAHPQVDIAPQLEGDAAIKAVLPPGVYTFALSDRLNGALRSPTLPRTHAKVSFEVLGGRFSLARLVFNNCQLNYNHQHSIHNDDWSWITLDFPAETADLLPYAELLTFWDNPKFPDPLGTLGKDVENQRRPYAEHAKNPRTWWGLRRIVLHDTPQPPPGELGHLLRLFEGDPPDTPAAIAGRYASVAQAAIERCARGEADDADTRWLNWFVKVGLLSNRAAASPRLAELVARYRQLEQELPQPTTVLAMADEGDGVAQPFYVRGDQTRPNGVVPRDYVQVLCPPDHAAPTTGSGRRELATWIASPQNPMTARVIVNRVWQWVFGRGLVATPDDFGHLGELPSHPELLDHLAAEFLADGWSIKRLVRRLVLTRTFQGHAVPTESARQWDPDNRLLAHWAPRRGEAEVIRDGLLAVSGRLDPTPYGPSIHPFRELADTEKRLYEGPLDGDGRRSLYIKFQLMEAPRFLSAFNLPGGKLTQGRREASNTPAQSLAMLNDPLVWRLADHWAERLVAEPVGDPAARIERMFQRALGRNPTAEERERWLSALRSLAAARGVSDEGLSRDPALWADLAHAMFNLQEFLFIP